MNKNLFNGNIMLIGFMGSGKSSVSRYFNRKYGLEVVEMDQLIVEQQGMSINDIFTKYGEEYFRNLETELLINIQSKNNVVVSCGGGVAMRDRNVVEMKKNGTVVLLEASPQTILDRVKHNNDRPLLKGKKNVEAISELMEVRRPKYQAAADIVIKTDNKSVKNICEEVIEKLNK